MSEETVTTLLDTFDSPRSVSTQSVVVQKEVFQNPEFQADFTHIAQQLRLRLDSDTSVFAPKPTTTDEPVIDRWLKQYETRFLTYLPELFFEQYPGLQARYKTQVGALANQLLPFVREDLRQYALRRLAIRWSARRYPDAAGLGEPERTGNVFTIPVIALRDNRKIGQVVLTENGTVLPGASTGQELREALASSVNREMLQVFICH